MVDGLMIFLTQKEARKFCPACMDESPRVTYEQRREQLLTHILERKLLIDESIKTYLMPVQVEEVEKLVELEADLSHIREALPEEVPRILQLFDWMRFIKEGIAE